MLMDLVPALLRAGRPLIVGQHNLRNTQWKETAPFIRIPGETEKVGNGFVKCFG